MDPITLAALGGAGLGIGKGILDQNRERKDRQIAAQTARWSPWTGMAAQPVQRADLLGSTIQGGLQGASFGQGLGQQQDFNKYLDLLKQQQMQNTPNPGYLSQTNLYNTGSQQYT